MNLPDYWLARPQFDLAPALRTAFDSLLDAAAAHGPNALLDYSLPAPKWQFLCYAAEARGWLCHGSGNPGITLFEPRQSNDLSEFGNRKAVYAAGDGLWAMFFAIVDRDRFDDISVSNACIRLAAPGGQVSEPRYVLSITRGALAQSPWRSGWVYLLPPATFETQPPLPFGDFEVRIPHCASLVPVAPLGRLAVAPSDFPFLHQIRGHDNARLAEIAAALNAGAPWPDD